MIISFKYNGKIWNPKNPEKKLKQLGITWDDVEIIEQSLKKESTTEYADPYRLYYFINPETNYSYTSIYNECPDGFIPTTYDYLLTLWKQNKTNSTT